LLATGGHDRQEVLHKMTPGDTVRPVAGLAPLHGVAQGPVELSEEIAPPAGLQNRACHFHGTRLLS